MPIIRFTTKGIGRQERYIKGLTVKLPKASDQSAAEISERIAMWSRRQLTFATMLSVGKRGDILMARVFKEKKRMYRGESVWWVRVVGEAVFFQLGAREHVVSIHKHPVLQRWAKLVLGRERGPITLPGRFSFQRQPGMRFLEKSIEIVEREIPSIINKQLDEVIIP